MVKAKSPVIYDSAVLTGRGLLRIVISLGRMLGLGMVGHSLVNHQMPQTLRGVSAGAGTGFTVYEQIINGSPLSRSLEDSRSRGTGR